MVIRFWWPSNNEPLSPQQRTYRTWESRQAAQGWNLQPTCTVPRLPSDYRRRSTSKSTKRSHCLSLMRTNSVAHTRQLELGRRLARRTLPHLGDGQPLPANVPAWMESSRDAEAFQSQLATLRKALHKLLDNPLRLVEKCGGREVILFESIIYRISPKARHIDALRVDSSGHLFQDGYTRDVFPVLSRRMALLPLLDRLGIWERTPQADLFLDSKTLTIRKLALAAAVWPALKRDWRFRYLRHSLLPQRLALDKDVLSLALRCRLDPKESVTTQSFTSVWQQKELLETVARENSGLLPLILHGLERQVLDPRFDLVQALRANLLNRGVTPAAWRHLTHHGARLFRPFWERKPDTDLFHLAAEYLCWLDEMGLPPPPSLAVTRTWLDIETGYCNGELHWNRGWWNLPAPILSAAFHNPRRTDPTFLREFAAAAHWAIFEQPTLGQQSTQSRLGLDQTAMASLAGRTEHPRGGWRCSMGIPPRGNSSRRPDSCADDNRDSARGRGLGHAQLPGYLRGMVRKRRGAGIFYSPSGQRQAACRPIHRAGRRRYLGCQRHQGLPTLRARPTWINSLGGLLMLTPRRQGM